MSPRSYYVYIMSNYSRILYIGVTNDLERRIGEHKSKLIDGFTKRYNVTKLIYVEECGEIEDAIRREKEIKGWRREKKLALIQAENPGWLDLFAEFSDPSLRSG